MQADGILAGMKDADVRTVVESPCIRLCTLNEHDICLGCGRTIEEICGWRAMDDTDRRQTLTRARLRQQRLDPLRKSREMSR